MKDTIRRDTAHAVDIEALWKRRLEVERRLHLSEGAEEDFHTIRAWFTAQIITLGLKAVGLYRRGYSNAAHPVLREADFAYAGLPPALDGVRLLHVSDLHLSRKDQTFANAMQAFLEGIEADLCLLTGDYRYGYYGPQEDIPDRVAGVLSGVRARHGTFAVLGNHDLAEIVPGLRAGGIEVLVNAGRLVEMGEASIWVGGVDDPHRFRCASIRAAWQGKPADAFGLLLAHSPEIIKEAAKAGADLYLCGHTHGGQVRLPVIGAPLSNADCTRKQALGRWQEGAMQGYTTAGLGVTDIPIRFGCPPEAMLITLRRKDTFSGEES